jgi:hypothetical protein
MKRLLTIAIALAAMASTTTLAHAGLSSSPGSRAQEMDHGRTGEWIQDVERPSSGYRRPT